MWPSPPNTAGKDNGHAAPAKHSPPLSVPLPAGQAVRERQTGNRQFATADLEQPARSIAVDASRQRWGP